MLDAEVKILKTKDYSIFKMLPGNRILAERKIKLLINDINHGNNFLKYFPILVDSEMNVLDGQHRLFAAKKTNSFIYYIIADKKIDISLVASMNSRSSSWNQKDYLNCYIRRNNPNYQKVQSLMEETQVKISTAIQLLTGDNIKEYGGALIAKRFMSGQFEATNYEKVVLFMQKIKNNFYWFDRYRSRQFLSLTLEVYKKHGASGIEKLSERIKDDEQLKSQLHTTNMKYYLHKVIEEMHLN